MVGSRVVDDGKPATRLHAYAKARQRARWSEVEPLIKRAEAALDGTTLPDPVRSTLHTNAGIAAFYADDLPKAIELEERALKLPPRGKQSPSLSWMHFVRCSLEAARQDVDATRAACDTAIERSNAEPKSDTRLRMELDRAEYLALAGAKDEAFAALLPLQTAGGSPTPSTARLQQALALQAEGRAGRCAGVDADGAGAVCGAGAGGERAGSGCLAGGAGVRASLESDLGDVRCGGSPWCVCDRRLAKLRGNRPIQRVDQSL